MQKLLSLKLASNFPGKLSNTSSSSSSFLHCHRYKTLSPLTQTSSNSTPQHPLHFFSLFSSFSWLSQNTFSRKIYGVLSNPMLVKQFLSNTHLRVPSSSLIDCRVWFRGAQFSGRSCEFNSSCDLGHRGWRSWFSRFTASDVVLGLIIANIAVFLLWRVADPKFMTNNFTISVENIRSGRMHTLITSAFSNIRVEHLIIKMVQLYIFWTSIVKVFGPEFLLKLYLAGAVGGSVSYIVHHVFMVQSSKGQGLGNMDPSRTPGLGTGGAVNAIMLLKMFLYAKHSLYLRFMMPDHAASLGIIIIGLDMLRIIQGNNHTGSDLFGGAVVAAIAWAGVMKGRRF